MSGEALTLFVHPDDVNLADVKALAAERNATVIGSRNVKHGQCYFVHPSVMNFGSAQPVEDGDGQ